MQREVIENGIAKSEMWEKMKESCEGRWEKLGGERMSKNESKMKEKRKKIMKERERANREIVRGDKREKKK